MIHPHLPAGCQTRTPEQRLTRPVSRFRKLGWQLPAISHPPHRVCTVCVYIWNGEFFSAPVCSIIVLLCFTILLCIMPIESWIEYISIALHYIHTCIYVHIRAYTYIYVHIRTFSLLLLFLNSAFIPQWWNDRVCFPLHPRRRIRNPGSLGSKLLHGTIGTIGFEPSPYISCMEPDMTHI